MAFPPGKAIAKITTNVVVSPELVAALVPALLPSLVPLLVAPLLPVLAPVLPILVPALIPAAIPALVAPLVPVLSPALAPVIVPELVPLLTPLLVPAVIPALVAPLVPVLAPALAPVIVPELVPLLTPVLVPALVTPLVTAIVPLVVSSFNTRVGVITLTSSDVTTALGFSPAGTVTNTFTGLQTLSSGLTVSSGAISLGGVGGTLGFFGSSPVVKQVSGENITNNVTPSGTSGVIPNIPLANYNSDGPIIREALYQLARKLSQVNSALRTYGILT